MMKTPQSTVPSSQNVLAKQMQLLNVSSPIGKQKNQRSASAGLVVPSQPEKPPSGAFRRRPAAHLQALEASRRNGTVTAKDRAVAALTVSVRAKDACNTLRSNLAALMFKMDFYAVDRYSRTRGEEALSALCQQLEQLNYLSQSFCRIVSPYDQRTFAHSSKGPNSMRIKSYVVALQAVADKLPNTIETEAARQITQVVDQGLLEQILSWIGEIEHTYDLIRPATDTKHAPCPVQPPKRQEALAQHVGRPDVRRRMLSIGAKRDTPSSSPDSSTSQDSDRKERMHRHRPPSLVIPETSFERKTRSRQ